MRRKNWVSGSDTCLDRMVVKHSLCVWLYTVSLLLAYTYDSLRAIDVDGLLCFLEVGVWVGGFWWVGAPID